MTIVYAVGLMVLLAFVEGMEESEVFGFLMPYEQYISVGLVVLLGHLAVQAGAKFVFASRSEANDDRRCRNAANHDTAVGIWADILLPGFRFD